MINFDKEFVKTMQTQAKAKSVLLHTCCVPCALYCIDYLKGFDIKLLKLFFFNPNIVPKDEYIKRAEQIKKLDLPSGDNGLKITYKICDYDSGLYLNRLSEKQGQAKEQGSEFAVLTKKAIEKEKTETENCPNCFYFRLLKTAEYAAQNDFDFFCTTLTVSPHKNSLVLNQIGKMVEGQTGVKFIPSDFKKNDGFKKSTILSDKLNIYRQNYCGCALSNS
ncbi:MAG: epoxyqueuosine reductase QueH [Firmicutes bacterium]|nr:epoxyqueuosine reductase QueH [Bacillota bacterium]